MMRYALLGLSQMLAMLFPFAAVATPGADEKPKPADKDIVITGKAPVKRQAVIDQAHAVSSTADPLNSTVARFSGPVCPAVYGLSSELNAMVRAYVRKDAAAVGIPVDGEKCTPNASIIFVPNGQAVIKALLKAKPALFGALSLEQQRILANDPGPVHIWRSVEVRGSGGDLLDNGGGTGPATLKVWWPSHILLTTQLSIAGSVIMIDLPAATGKTVAQLAGYSAMRLFAETRPPRGDVTTATILTLFDETDAPRPRSLTSFDLAFLQTTYRAGSGQMALTTLSSVAHTLQKDQAVSAKR